MRSSVVDLLCLPWAGASATAYARWQRRLPRWIRVVPVELSGRGERLGEPFVEDFERLVTQLCQEQARSLQGRYALFGHSMGALLAYAMAQLQGVQGTLPCALFVSGSPAPAHRKPGRFTQQSDEALIADLRKQGGTPEAVFRNAELLRMALDTLRADYRACASFRYGAAQPLRLPIHAFGGRLDEVAAEQVEGWRHEASGLFTLDWFDGGHFFIREQEERVLAAIVRELAPQAPGAGRAAMVIA